MFLRLLLTFAAVCVISSFVMAGVESADGIPYLKERISSEWWQVRYCLLRDLDSRDDNCKKLLERLAADENESVSSQALERYVSNYSKVDKNLILPQIENMRPIPDGITFSNQPDVRSAGFYSSMLEINRIDEASNARSIMFIGLTGKPEDAEKIKPYMQSKNDYVLLKTAKALYRLGDEKSAVILIHKILAKDVKKHIHYQTEALYVLSEIDKKSCEDEYRKLRKRVEKVRNEIQPNRLSGYFVQGLQLNIDVK